MTDPTPGKSAEKTSVQQFFDVCATGTPEEVFSLLNKLGNLYINTRNAQGDTGLHLAHRHGNWPTVAALVKHGADLHARNQMGDSPISFNHVGLIDPVIHALLRDAHPEGIVCVTEAFGLAAMAQAGDTAMEDLRMGLFVAVDENNVQDALGVILQGVDVNARNEMGLTPLHAMAITGTDKGVSAMMDLLVHNGAFIEAICPKGMTPLHWAATCGRTQAALDLLAHGANPNVTDRSGRTPQDLTIINDNASTAQALRAREAQQVSRGLIERLTAKPARP